MVAQRLFYISRDLEVHNKFLESKENRPADSPGDVLGQSWKRRTNIFEC